MEMLQILEFDMKRDLAKIIDRLWLGWNVVRAAIGAVTLEEAVNPDSVRERNSLSAELLLLLRCFRSTDKPEPMRLANAGIAAHADNVRDLRERLLLAP